MGVWSGVKVPPRPSFPFVVYLVRRVRGVAGPVSLSGVWAAAREGREGAVPVEVETDVARGGGCDTRVATRDTRCAVVGSDGEAYAVRVRGLVKSYAGVSAVQGIDLDIRHGEIFALLGPNGAGKTTTVEILEGYRTRDDGAVSVLGCDPGRERARLKPRIGIVLQSTGVERYSDGARDRHDVCGVLSASAPGR